MTRGEVRDSRSRAARIRSWSDVVRRLTGPKPIGLYLSLLIAVTIVPAIAVSLVLLQRNNDAQREVVMTLAETTAGSIAEAADRELSGMVTTLRVLSTTPSLADDAIRDFYRRAQLALAGSGSYISLLDENLTPLMDTRVPYGSALGPTSDPESVTRAMERRGVVISGVFYDETAQRSVFKAVLPHIPEEGPPRILIMTRNAESLMETLSQQMLRGGWNAALLDQNDTVIVSSYLSSDVGEPFFLDLEEDASAAPLLVRGPESETYAAIVGQSGYSGWKSVVWAPTSAIEQPMRRSLRGLLVGTLIVIAIGAAAAWLLGRQIARSVRGLAKDARRLGAGEAVSAVDYPIAEVSTVSQAMKEAALDRKNAENDIRLLMREVAHRAKNQLTVVASMAKQTARSARTFKAFEDSFQKRLYGLARSTDLLIAGGASGVRLRELLLAQIEPFRPMDEKRLTMKGPEFKLASQAAQTIGLAVHEMATNASKYGAFSVRQGRLDITWRVEGGKLVIDWREHMPRLRRRPQRHGFGSEIIERMLGGTLDATISRTYHNDGLECVFTIPVERVLPESARHGP